MTADVQTLITKESVLTTVTKRFYQACREVTAPLLSISLAATPAFAYNLTLSWDRVDQESRITYRLEGGTTSGGTEVGVFNAGTAKTYTVEDLDEGTMYYFRVKAAVSDDNQSEASLEISHMRAVPGQPSTHIEVLKNNLGQYRLVGWISSTPGGEYGATKVTTTQVPFASDGNDTSDSIPGTPLVPHSNTPDSVDGRYRLAAYLDSAHSRIGIHQLNPDGARADACYNKILGPYYIGENALYIGGYYHNNVTGRGVISLLDTTVGNGNVYFVTLDENDNEIDVMVSSGKTYPTSTPIALPKTSLTFTAPVIKDDGSIAVYAVNAAKRTACIVAWDQLGSTMAPVVYDLEVAGSGGMPAASNRFIRGPVINPDGTYGAIVFGYTDLNTTTYWPIDGDNYNRVTLNGLKTITVTPALRATVQPLTIRAARNGKFVLVSQYMQNDVADNGVTPITAGTYTEWPEIDIYTGVKVPVESWRWPPKTGWVLHANRKATTPKIEITNNYWVPTSLKSVKKLASNLG